MPIDHLFGLLEDEFERQDIETPAPQKNTTRPSSWAFSSLFGISIPFFTSFMMTIISFLLMRQN
jgi:hypothetical protein